MPSKTAEPECETDSGGQNRDSIYVLVRDGSPDKFNPSDPTANAVVMKIRGIHIAQKNINGALKQYLWFIADPTTEESDPLNDIQTQCITLAETETFNAYWQVQDAEDLGQILYTLGQQILNATSTDAMQINQLVNTKSKGQQSAGQ
jgi:hypothetical protein